jgi:hypothetical protein
MSMKNSNETIGNRNFNLQNSSRVPQATALLCAPEQTFILLLNNTNFSHQTVLFQTSTRKHLWQFFHSLNWGEIFITKVVKKVSLFSGWTPSLFSPTHSQTRMYVCLSIAWLSKINHKVFVFRLLRPILLDKDIIAHLRYHFEVQYFLLCFASLPSPSSWHAFRTFSCRL